MAESEIEVGTWVRVKEGCSSATPGEVFQVTRIGRANNPYTWNGSRHVPDPGRPNWYAMGDQRDNGVWAQFLEIVDTNPYEEKIYDSSLNDRVHLSMEGGPAGIELFIYDDYDERFANVTLNAETSRKLLFDLQRMVG